MNNIGSCGGAPQPTPEEKKFICVAQPLEQRRVLPNACAQDGRRPQQANIMSPRAQTAFQHGGVNLHAVLAVRHIVADQ